MIELNGPHDVAAVSVGTTATKLLPDAEAAKGRRFGVYIQPEADIFVGGPSVTTSTGLLIIADQILFQEWTYGQEWYGVAAAGTVNVRVVPVF